MPYSIEINQQGEIITITQQVKRGEEQSVVFHASESEIDKGEGISWDDLKNELDLD